MGDNGLIKRAEKASQMQANAEASDQEAMSELDKIIADKMKGTTGNEKDKKLRILQSINTDLDDITASNTIYVVPQGGYSDIIDYVLIEKLDKDERDRLITIMYVLTGDEEDVSNTFSELKTNNLTMTEYMEQNMEIDTYNYLWNQLHGTFINKVYSTYFEYIVDEISQSDKITFILNVYNAENSGNETDINKVITEYSGMNEMFEMMAEYSKETFIDFIYGMINANDIYSIYVERIEQIPQLYGEEYDETKVKAEEMTLELPNGDVVTTNATVVQTIKDNGTYVFEVTYEGKSETYTIEVNTIDDKCSECGLVEGYCICEPCGEYPCICDCEECGEYPCVCEPCEECGKLPASCVCGMEDEEETCPECGEYPCVCEEEACLECGENPCICPCEECGEYPCVCEEE